VYAVSAFSGFGERKSTVIQNVTAMFITNLGDNDSDEDSSDLESSCGDHRTCRYHLSDLVPL